MTAIGPMSQVGVTYDTRVAIRSMPLGVVLRLLLFLASQRADPERDWTGTYGLLWDADRIALVEVSRTERVEVVGERGPRFGTLVIASSFRSCGCNLCAK